MYTQCPDCATVFRVTAEALRAAQGDVRCGVCSTSFNALENLSEQPFRPDSPDAGDSPDDSITVEELPGGESIELSEPAQEAAATEEDEDRALEFRGEAADLDRLFVIEAPEAAAFDPAAVAATLAGTRNPDQDEPADKEEPGELDPTDEHPILVLEETDEPIEEAPSVESIVLETPAAPTPQTAPAPASSTAPRILIPDEMRRRLAEEAAARAAARDFGIVDEPEPSPSRRWPWIAGIGALALLLALQIVHSRRNDLVRSPSIGPVIAGAYSLFGLSPLAPTDLSAYELRQWGAATDPNEADRLLLRASIVNRAGFAQPLPLLRLVLQDRFGGTLAMRDIGPADYLPGRGASGLLDPGGRADALIRIVDPGVEAVGFELDVCLPAPGGVRCANPITTARQ